MWRMKEMLTRPVSGSFMNTTPEVMYGPASRSEYWANGRICVMSGSSCTTSKQGASRVSSTGSGCATAWSMCSHIFETSTPMPRA